MFDASKTAVRVFVPVKGPDRIMVNIKKYKQPTAHLTLVGGDLQECSKVLHSIIEPMASTFKKGKHVNIEMREYIGGKNGKSTSFSFYTKEDEVPPQVVSDFIVAALSSVPVMADGDEDDSVI